MENTLENKSKFFAQYINKRECIIRKGFKKRDNINPNGIDAFDILELTPLHLISDEDAQKLPNRQYDGFTKTYEDKEEFLNTLEVMRFLTQEETDILRSLGYAINFQDLSVEEQVSRGWVVLKTEI